ncbi:lantibiotic protein [Streptomyces sp. NPDC096324]|uniref:lantibiotic protein n=1 Tax=Streptomyces sp. NPDC096324 TaxID=3366085 RepID=UPI00380EBED5
MADTALAALVQEILELESETFEITDCTDSDEALLFVSARWSSTNTTSCTA